MTSFTRLLAVTFVAASMAGISNTAAAQSCDPAITNLEVASQWRYRDPYAKRLVSVTLKNLGTTNFESPRGQQYVCVYAREISKLSGVMRERMVMRMPFERLAAGEELTFAGHYFQEIERNTNPARIAYRAEIIYEPALSGDANQLNDDLNFANNKATANTLHEASQFVTTGR